MTSVEYQGKRFKDLYTVEVGPGAQDKDWQQVSLAGMAAFGGKLYVANRRTNSLLVINPEDGAQQGEIPLPKPGPLTASADALYAISDGALVRIDDFLVTVAQADGTRRSVARRGDDPKVEIQDPLAEHRALLAVYSDKNMHDVTAYLATIK